MTKFPLFSHKRSYMTKKSLLTLVWAIFLVLMFAACGSDKKEPDKPDTGDTEAVTDTDPTDTGDTPTVPDEEPADTGDAEVIPDEDNTDTGNVTREGCTIKSSFGSHSAKRDLMESCVKEIAKADSATCDWNYKNEEVTVKHIAYLQRLVITFGNECKDKNEDKLVECPDFIPKSLKLGNLSGCDVYSVVPNTDCETQCADLYFTTDDKVFHTVYVGAVGGEIGNEAFIRSSDAIKGASFISELKIGSNKATFTWSETAEDGSKIEKKVSAEMIVDVNSPE